MSGQIIRLQRRDDPRIAPYVAIRERDLTGGKDGRFIIEGKVPLQTLLRQSRFRIDSLFLCETRLAPLSRLLDELPSGLPVYVGSQKLMDEIAGYSVHRGVLACACKGEGLSLTALIKAAQSRQAPLLVLNQISNHDNVGAAFRNAAAFDASGIILDARSCDPLYRKSIRVSSGACLWLPYHQGGSGMDHILALKQAGYDIWALTPRSDAMRLDQLKRPERLALLLGSEGTGLAESLLAAAQPLRIPMRDGFDSLNVATAGAIALAHLHMSQTAG